MSDTQRFILDDVFSLWRLNNKDVLAKEMKGNGKFCILKSNGEIELYGDFIEKKKVGYSLTILMNLEVGINITIIKVFLILIVMTMNGMMTTDIIGTQTQKICKI